MKIALLLALGICTLLSGCYEAPTARVPAASPGSARTYTPANPSITVSPVTAAPIRVSRPAAMMPSARLPAQDSASLPPSTIVNNGASRQQPSVQTQALPGTPVVETPPSQETPRSQGGGLRQNGVYTALQSPQLVPADRAQVLAYFDWMRRAENDRRALMRRNGQRSAVYFDAFSRMLLNPDGDSAVQQNSQAIQNRINMQSLADMRNYLDAVRRTKPFAPEACSRLDVCYIGALAEEYQMIVAIARGEYDRTWLETKDAKIASLLGAADKELSALSALYNIPKSFSIWH